MSWTTVRAAQFGFTDRGRLVPGLAADLVIFNPATVGETSTYAAPPAYPTGIAHVIVNGVAVVADGKQTDARPGQVLRHKR